MAVSHSGKVLATGSSDQSVRLWDLDTGKQTHRIRFGKGNPTAVRAIAFSPDGELLAAAGYHHPDLEFVGFLSLRDTKSGKAVFEQEVTGRATAIAFSPDGKTFAVAPGRGSRIPVQGKKPVISLWDTASRKPGGGELESPVPILTGGKPIDVEHLGDAALFVGDFDDDGRKDLLVGNRLYVRNGEEAACFEVPTAHAARAVLQRFAGLSLLVINVRSKKLPKSC